MSDIQTLEAKITELTKLVQSGVNVDMDAIMADMKKHVDALVNERLAAMPVYPSGSGDGLTGVGKNNRYFRHAQEIARTGKSQFGPVEIKAADFALTYQFMRKAHALMPDTIPAPSEDLQAVMRVMTTPNYSEIMDEILADTLWEDIIMAARVASTLQPTPMPSNPFRIPLGLGDPTWRKGTEATATTASDLTPGDITLTATELVTEVQWSYTLNEDTIIQLMPTVRSNISRSGGKIVDAFILNADSSTSGNINLSDGTPSSDAYYLTDGQDGLRHLPLVDNTSMKVDAGGSALTDANIVSALTVMDKYAAAPNDVVIVTNVRTYMQGFLKPGTGAPAEYLMTLDKIGRDAIVLTGQVAAYRGIPIILSDQLPLTSADGTVTNAGPNDKGQVVIYNRTRWLLGFRRNLLVEVERDIRNRKFIIVASMRPAVGAFGNRASATHTAAIINVAV